MGREWKISRLLSLAVFFATGSIAHAQIGNGWIETNPNKRVHLDDEEGLQTFGWSSFRQVGVGTPCADYRYVSATDTEIFRIFDSRSNRSEIRLENDYNTGTFQFEGYVKFYEPLHDESLFQIFGNSGEAATFLMMRGYRNNGGEIRVMSGSNVIASGVYSKEVRINIIHEQNVAARFYVDGEFKHQKADNDTGATNYWKYGCYGTTNGNVPAVVEWRAVRTFRYGGPVEPPPGTYEAEAAALNGAQIVANNFGFTGAGYVDYVNPSGDYVEWNVNAPAPGLYKLAFRHALASGSRPLEIRVNGKVVEPAFGFPATGSWSNWQYATPPLQELIAGTNKIRATAIGSSGPDMDHLIVSHLEAEDAVLNGAVVASNTTEYTGSGFADYINASGDYIQWNFSLTKAGRHDLTFRYALQSGNRPLEIRINGQVARASMSFPATGGFNNWLDAVLANQPLVAGANTVRATATGSSGPNVDHLKLTPVANTAATGEWVLYGQ